MSARLKSFDRETLKAVIASREGLTPEDAEEILNRLEKVRDDTIVKFDSMKEEIDRRVQESRQQMWELAEDSRRTAAKAAWWTFANRGGLRDRIGSWRCLGRWPRLINEH